MTVRSRPVFAACVFGFTLLGCGGDPASGNATPVGGSTAIAGTSGSLAGSAIGGGGVASDGGQPSVAGSGGGGAPAGGVPSGGETGAGGSSTSGGGAGGAGPAMVGVFVAQGHQGRITRSCDDGLTFPYNHSNDDTFRCFIDANHDCDHSEFAGRGLAFGDGSFVATWGWGHPGKLQRSIDGKAWSDVMTQTPTFADVAYGNSMFVAGGNPTPISSDGKTWEMGGKLSFDFNYRGIEFVLAAGGTFIVTGESGDQRAISFSHDGKTWTAAADRPDLCGQQLRGIVGSDSVMLVVSALGGVCRSTDGNSWTYAAVTDSFTSPPIWTGTEFWIYGGNKQWKSTDGITWTSVALDPPNMAVGPLARSPSGTLVAANDGWQVWYEKQHFFRSTDGQHWDLLPPSAFTGSHPINFISFGYVPPTAGCGLP